MWHVQWGAKATTPDGNGRSENVTHKKNSCCYSLVPRPVRAIRVIRGGLEPSAIGEFSGQA